MSLSQNDGHEIQKRQEGRAPVLDVRLSYSALSSGSDRVVYAALMLLNLCPASACTREWQTQGSQGSRRRA